MPVLFSYLLKLSVSLAVVFLFYQFVLRRLTFYNWNRWYLLGYTFLSFFIPFIDITGILERNELAKHDIVTWVPAITVHMPYDGSRANFSIWNGALILFIIGILVKLIRLFIQLISFYRMRRKAVSVSQNGLNIFHVNDNIIPFSFGNSIFINRNLHSASELEEIIRHEFIHVKQKHSFDIMWGEVLCLLNWYNPFAWLLKKSIRQNLEFIADNKVIENGIDKKEYQWMLLKVIGDTQFSIATQFNFSSLKKRIAMMNKTKSARRQIARFLFLLPVFAIILLSFRKSFNDPVKTGNRSIIFTDTVPEVKTPNSKGYLIDIKDNKGNCTVVVKDKNKKEVTRLLLTEWNEKADYYENLYGEIPPTSKPPASVQPVQKPQEVQRENPVQPAQPAQRPQPASPANAMNTNVNAIAAEYDIKDDKATVKLKDGRTEVYNLRDDKEKKQFIEKYSDPVIVDVATISNVNINSKIAPALVTTLKHDIVSNNNLTTVAIANLNTTIESENVLQAKLATAIKSTAVTNLKGVTAIAPMDASEAVIIADEYDHSIGGVEDVLLTITKNTTRKQLDDFIKQAKEKGIELEYDDIEYNKEVLVKLTGTMKSSGGHSNFVAVDFEKLILSTIKKGDKTYFKVTVQDKRKVVV